MKNLDRNTILNFLKENKSIICERFGVVKIGLIGSYSRNEQNENSDIDFLVEFTEPKFDYHAGLLVFLENNLGRKVEIIRNRKTLRKSFIERIQKDVVYA